MSDVKINLDHLIPNLLNPGKPVMAIAPRMTCGNCGHVMVDGEDRKMDIRYVLVGALVSHRSKEVNETLGMYRLAEKFSDMTGEVTLGIGDQALIKTALESYDVKNHVLGAIHMALEDGKQKDVKKVPEGERDN